jgi:hypothetical protein
MGQIEAFSPQSLNGRCRNRKRPIPAMIDDGDFEAGT